MARHPRQPKLALELRFDEAATPARVAATALFVDRVLAAADPKLPADSVTLVVSNYSTVASVRAWTRAGDDVLRRCEQFLRSPSREVKKDPTTRRMAGAIAEAAEEILPFRASVAKPKARKAIATINERLVTSLKNLSSPPTATSGPEPPVIGSTQILSPIYRVGRLDEGKEVLARIRVDGRPYDVRIDTAAIDAAFDVAKTGATVPIDIDGEWSRGEANALALDASKLRITRVGSGWKPIAGSEFLDAIHAALPDVFADLTDLLPEDAH
jgi:hypothetical protein